MDTSSNSTKRRTITTLKVIGITISLLLATLLVFGCSAHRAGTAPAPADRSASGSDGARAPHTSTQAAARLQQDAFDAPAAIAIQEANRATSGATHENHDHSAPAAVDPHAAHVSETAAPQQTTYTCPMHPEVASVNPGNCPKCGMTLVKKDS